MSAKDVPLNCDTFGALSSDNDRIIKKLNCIKKQSLSDEFVFRRNKGVSLNSFNEILHNRRLRNEMIWEALFLFFVAFEEDIRRTISRNGQGKFAQAHKPVNYKALKNSFLDSVN